MVNERSVGVQPVCPMCGGPVASPNDVCPKCGEDPKESRFIVRKFRWRIIPAVFLGIYSALGLLIGIVHLGAWFVVVAMHQTGSPFGKATSEHGITVMSIATSVVWGCAARFWWKGRWWPAVGLTLLGYLAGALCAWLFRL